MKFIFRFLAVPVFLCTLAITLFAQPKSYSLANAHSHNDYVNPVPFYKAFNRGFGSIEADVYPVNGELLVAHAKNEIISGNTLKRLYLDPLLAELKKNPKRKLTFLIDIKENPPETLARLLELLKPFKKYLSRPGNEKNLSIIISGKKTAPSLYTNYPDFIQFDSDLTVAHNAEQWERIGMVSLPFTKFSKWKGEGKLPDTEEARLKKTIDSVHGAGKVIRFWAAPDNANSWTKFMSLGIDILGTDKIDELADFLGGKGASTQSATKQKTTNTKLTGYVNPFIGTGSTDQHSLSGSNFPGATLPFGFVQLSPDTRAVPHNPDSGYDYNEKTIVGFSHTHLSGTGVAELFDVLVMPRTGEIKTEPGEENKSGTGYRSLYSHDQESARPGYYQVKLLDYGVNAELTATEHAGFHRYTFPKSTQSHILIDMDHSRNKGKVSNYGETCKIIGAQIKWIDNKTVEGYRVMTGWARLRKVYFRMEFSKPMKDMIMVDGKQWYENQKTVNGTNGIKAVINFDTDENEQILVKVGLSAVSTENAALNLSKEITSWDFDKIVTEAENKWEKELQKIKVEGTDEQKQIFYTALYHAFTQPNNMADVNGDYQATDMTIKNAPDKVHYSTFSLWDTFRAAHPLYTLVQPERTADFINSMLRQQEAFGFLPVWQLWGDENYCMIGNHAIPVLVDAALKGMKGFDKVKAYEAVKASSLRNHAYFPVNIWEKYGYIPEDLQSQSVSLTLEIAYDDWCVAQLAKNLGKQNDYDYFMKRAHFYKNLYDSKIGFFRSKNKDGKWIEPFDPVQYGDNGGHPFTEGNAWQYFWFVPHDVKGLINLVGGDKAFTEKLDKFFTLKAVPSKKNNNASGFIGQYAHGNEPSHHVTYLYNYAGQPWKAQYYAGKVLRELYDNTSAGYSGNEDCGQMASWYVLSAMGFYPVNPANGIYVFGSPVLKEASIELAGGKKFLVKALNASKGNFYIQSVKLNGKPYNKTYITHSDLSKGGSLEFVMGDKPNYKWGVSETAKPLEIGY